MAYDKRVTVYGGYPDLKVSVDDGSNCASLKVTDRYGGVAGSTLLDLDELKRLRKALKKAVKIVKENDGC